MRTDTWVDRTWRVTKKIWSGFCGFLEWFCFGSLGSLGLIVLILGVIISFVWFIAYTSAYDEI